ncbi:hypothetical protein BKA62DRAFT_712707 [Auriculariales sp. MPI-PUGE-AT-0066]|nr:hypothetical protein BKA62DRAFT_712707 [Auriculariales sp. MPI-PUGE-AT-0066]
MASRLSTGFYALLFSAVLIGSPTYTILDALQFDVASGLPQISEARILEVAKTLETIGYRSVGTREHALADAWALKQVEELAASCPPHLQCETWRQVGDGTHRFDMMGKVVWKSYHGLTNIILRVSSGTPTGKANAVLVNCHLDSTLPSPGAADDAMPCGVMLEIARVLTHTPQWNPEHAIIFLFNNAEESLQDGSHLYSTQHETRHTVRAGPELLFQATSEEMISAYSHAKQPFGTVVANEIFSSGIILSDTDFRQFEEYLNVTGLDMAVVGHSYYYHTRKDIVANIEPGVAQHMAENTLSIVEHLTSADSPLGNMTTSGFHKPSTTFFSLFGSYFFQYSSRTALIMSGTVAFNAYGLARSTVGLKRVAGGTASVLIMLLGALLSANILAFIMDRVHPLSWYSNELSCILLYGPAALAGAITVDHLFPVAKSEQDALAGLLVIQSSTALLLQGVFTLGSSAVLLVSSGGMFLDLKVDSKKSSKKGMAAAKEKRYGHSRNSSAVGVPNEPAVFLMPLISYAIAQVVPIIFGTELLIGDLDVFVPLTGRMGPDAPAEHIIASIVALFGAYSLPMIFPLARRIGRKALGKAIIGLWAVAVLSVGFLPPQHPRRVFITHMENVTSNELTLHVGGADRAGGMPQLAMEIAEEFGVKGSQATSVVMDDWNTEWDHLYPFSAFIKPHTIKLDTPKGFRSKWAGKFNVELLKQDIDVQAETRSLSISVKHAGIIWPVIAFDADILSWSQSAEPLKGMQRHHIKEGSFYGSSEWHFDLTVKGLKPLEVSFVGISERGMWPGKKHEAEGAAMELFAKLDPWIEKRTKDSVDALLLGCVGGVVKL